MASTAEFVTANLADLRRLDLCDPSMRVRGDQPISERRRSGAIESARTQQIVLVEEDGVLRWELGRSPIPTLHGRRSAMLTGPTGTTILPLRFEQLGPSEVWKALERIDDELSGPPGLLTWKQGSLVPASASLLDGKKRVLLFVHGTFSKSQALVDGIAGSSEAKAFWRWAKERYDAILFLNHHTLRPTPVANAMELARLFDGRDLTIHAVGHSRGCLVLRWWLEALDRGRGERRAVLVGGTLRGTSLASPPKLRAAVGLLTNILRVLHGTAAAATAIAPPLAPIVGLLKVLSFATSGLANTPLVDAGVAIVPGLAAMSRVGNNAELLALQGRVTAVPEGYFAVRADFQPEDPAWKFWKHFRGSSFANPVSDAIFAAENDLVVDTASMTELADEHLVPAHVSRCLDFGTQGTVHHLNYFEQAKTVKSIMTWLGAD